MKTRDIYLVSRVSVYESHSILKECRYLTYLFKTRHK